MKSFSKASRYVIIKITNGLLTIIHSQQMVMFSIIEQHTIHTHTHTHIHAYTHAQTQIYGKISLAIILNSKKYFIQIIILHYKFKARLYMWY